ncbi:MAG: hypothetical protein ACOCWG_01200 [bacterium]
MEGYRAKKKLLFISAAYKNESPVGIRFKEFADYFEKKFNLEVLNLSKKISVLSRKNKICIFINKVFMKFPLMPDPYVLILKEYKKNIKRILYKNKVDVIIIQVLPFSLIKLATYIKKIYNNVIVIIDLSDPYSASIKNLHQPKKIRNRMRNFEKNHFQNVDKLIVLNEELKGYYEELISKDNFAYVLEQGVNKKIIDSNLTNATTYARYLKFIYAGAFYKNFREPFNLYTAIQKTTVECKLAVFGGFKKRYKPPAGERFYYGGRISMDNLINQYEIADIIVFIDNKDSYQIPGKIFEILSLQKPILYIYYNDNTPSLKYFQKFDGIYYSKNNVKDIINAIHKIKDNRNKEIQRDLSDFTWQKLLDQFYNEVFTLKYKC